MLESLKLLGSVFFCACLRAAAKVSFAENRRGHADLEPFGAGYYATAAGTGPLHRDRNICSPVTQILFQRDERWLPIVRGTRA